MKPLFTFWGKVTRGKSRGKKLGFPTANTALHKKIPEGIYVSKITIDNKTYRAATFIGPAKTYAEKDYKAESYILDFNKSIYNQWISIRLLKKLRGNKKFSSEKELVEQIKEDILATREFFS